MVASLTSPGDVVNAAMRRIGYKFRVDNLFDGSDAASAALDVYAQTRDAMLRRQSWGFAERQAALVANGQTAPSGWAFEYTWPNDCLLLRAVVPSPIPSPNFAPMDILFTPYNDTRVGSGTRVILTTISPAQAIYTAQVTDMSQWDVSFAEAFIDELAKILLPALGDAKLLQLGVPGSRDSLNVALGASEPQPPSDIPVEMKQ